MLVLVLVGLAIAVLTERSTRAQVVASVGDTAQSVAQSLDAADNTNRELVQLTMKGFQRYFEATMQLDEASGELRSYGALVNEDYGSVDKFASETGGIATVFAKKGDDFVRITTSVKNDKGERQMGTPLGRTDPACATVSKGEPYTGVTVVNGKPFMGHYLPAKDASGKVIALLFIGNDISVFHAMLQKQVAQTKVFEHGGTYVINPGTSLDQAVFVYHPTARGKRVLEAYPQARHFFEALAASQDGFVREAADVLGTGAENPWALVRKTGGGWWVVAELADGDAMASQRRVTLAVWGLMAVAVVLLAIGLAGAVQVFKLSRGDGSAGHGGLGYAPARPWPRPWRRPATAKGSMRPAAAPGRPPSCNRARHRWGWSSGGLRPVVLGLCWPDSFHTPAHLHLWPPTSPPCWQ